MNWNGQSDLDYLLVHAREGHAIDVHDRAALERLGRDDNLLLAAVEFECSKLDSLGIAHALAGLGRRGFEALAVKLVPVTVNTTS